MFNCFCKSFILISICQISQANPMMPVTPQNQIGGDSVRARDGTTCTMGTHVGPTLDFGATASQNNNNTNSSAPPIIINTGSQLSTSNLNGGDVGVYARIVVPLGNEPDRLDCTRLYNLEIERLQIEIENLKKAGSSSVTIE